MVAPVRAYFAAPPRGSSSSAPSCRSEQPTMPAPTAKVASSVPAGETRVRAA